MEITGKNIDAFLKDFNEAMKSIGEKYDVTVSLGRITYTDTEFSAKMTVDNSRDPEQIASDRFDQDVWKYEEYGLQKGMYREIFRAVNGERYALMGFVPNAKKSPLRGICLTNGKRYRFGPGFIKEFLHAKYIDENWQ